MRSARGSIGTVFVNGNMSATSFAAGISLGADGKLGTADDIVVSNCLLGAINALVVKGSLTGSSNPNEQFGLFAHRAIGTVTAGGRLLAPASSLSRMPALRSVVGSIIIAPNWR